MIDARLLKHEAEARCAADRLLRIDHIQSFIASMIVSSYSEGKGGSFIIDFDSKYTGYIYGSKQDILHTLDTRFSNLTYSYVVRKTILSTQVLNKILVTVT